MKAPPRLVMLEIFGKLADVQCPEAQFSGVMIRMCHGLHFAADEHAWRMRLQKACELLWRLHTKSSCWNQNSD